MTRERKAIIGLFLTVIIALGSFQTTKTSTQSPNEFLINDGQIVYDGEFIVHNYPGDDDIEWEIRLERTDAITVTNLDSDTIQFSKRITFQITDAYLQAGEMNYTPESYAFAYTNENERVLMEFNDTNTHTAMFERTVSKTTGMRIQIENPIGLSRVYPIVYYNLSGSYETTWTYFTFTTSLTHSNLYFENSTSVEIGDSTMWGRVSEFTTVMGRNAIVITPEEGDAPEETLEYERKRYFDGDSGLLLMYNYVYVTENDEIWSTQTLRAQNVLDSITPISDLSLISPNDFAIYDGQIVYEEEYSFQQYIAEYDIRFGIELKVMMTVTVTNIGPDLVRFSQELRFLILDAYQQVGETTYTPKSFGFRYRDAEGFELASFGDTTTHTATIVRDVSKTTGMRIRSMTPLGLHYVDSMAYYDESDAFVATWYTSEFWPAQTYSDQFFENSTLIHIGDHTRWGTVSDFTTIADRNSLLITDDEIPEEAIEYKLNHYFDVVSGLQLGREWTYVSSTIEQQHTRTLISQTVLDTIAPIINQPNDLAFEAGTPDQMITWRPFDPHPATYSIRLINPNNEFVDAGAWNGSELAVDVSTLRPGFYEFVCYVSDESGHLTMDSIQVTVSGENDGQTPVPGFSLIPALLGLVALLWVTRHSKQ